MGPVEQVAMQVQLLAMVAARLLASLPETAARWTSTEVPVAKELPQRQAAVEVRYPSTRAMLGPMEAVEPGLEETSRSSLG
jgi:hypothetical protein